MEGKKEVWTVSPEKGQLPALTCPVSRGPLPPVPGTDGLGLRAGCAFRRPARLGPHSTAPSLTVLPLRATPLTGGDVNCAALREDKQALGA